MPGIWVTLSSAVCPEIREYERTSTAVANAYVQPLIDGYLARMAEALQVEQFRGAIYLVTSGGGVTSIETARRFPVRLVESGPAGGAIFAAQIAARLGESKVLSFDMGGTTAKICLIEKYQPETSRVFEVDRAARFLKGSRPAGAHSRDRDGRDRRRRRLDRACRCDEARHGRPRERRRPSRDRPATAAAASARP